MPEFSVDFVVTREAAKAAHAAEAKAYKDHVKDADKAAKAGESGATREGEAIKRLAALKRDLAQKGRDFERAKAKEREAEVRAAAAEEMRTDKLLADARKRFDKEAQESVDARIKTTEAAGGKLAGVFGMIGNAAYGLNGLSSVIGMIADSFERAKNQAVEAGKFAEDYRKALKEIAFLKGEPGATAPVVLGDLAFRQQTLQDQAGARSLQEEFRNTAGISIDTKDTRAKMTEEEAVKGMTYAGQMQAMYGGDGAAYGTLAGVIPSTEKADRVTGDDVKKRMYQLTKLGEKGRSSPAMFANQMAQAAYLVQGGQFKDMGQMGAYGSTLSLSRPNEVAQGLDQLTKMTAGSINDMTKGPNAQMAPGEYLKGLGMTDQNDVPQMLQAMMADMDRVKAEMAAQGKTFSPQTYLNQRGYDRQEAINTFQQLSARKSDLNNTLLPMADKLPTLDQADEGFKLFKRTQTGMAQAASVNADRTQFAFGGGAMEYYKSLQSRAIQAGMTSGRMTGSEKDWEGSRTASDDMLEVLRQEGIAKGLPYQTTSRYSSTLGTVTIDPLQQYFRGWAGTKERAEGYYELAQKISAAGGDPMGSSSKIMQDAAAAIERSNAIAEKSELALRGIVDKLNPAPVSVIPPGGANAGPVR